jgi:hypothetical protein
MSWKTILKEIRMDKDVNCCEEARMKIIEWFEHQIEIMEVAATAKDRPIKYDILITASQKLSESPCEDLRVDVEEVIQKLVSTSNKSVFTAIDDLVEILNDWDKCKEEPMKEKSPKKEYDWYKQTGDDTTAWMDKYFATGRA